MSTETGLHPGDIKDIQNYSRDRVRGNEIAEKAAHETFVSGEVSPNGFADRLRSLLSKLTGGSKHEPKPSDAGGSYLTEADRERTRKLGQVK